MGYSGSNEKNLMYRISVRNRNCGHRWTCVCALINIKDFAISSKGNATGPSNHFNAN